jgi:hypothetical protein
MACDPRTQAYLARRAAEGKTRKEIMRCLKRYAAREIYKALVNQARNPAAGIRSHRRAEPVSTQAIRPTGHRAGGPQRQQWTSRLASACHQAAQQRFARTPVRSFMIT